MASLSSEAARARQAADRRVDCVVGVVGRPRPPCRRWPRLGAGWWRSRSSRLPTARSAARSPGWPAYRWIMTIALLVVGACYFATAACLPAVRVPARIVLMVAGLSSIGIALSPGAGARFHPAAPCLDLARRGRYHGLASLHRPPGPLTTADPEGSRRGRRDCRLPRSAGLAHLRDPGRRRLGPGGAAGVRRRGDMATHRDPGAAVHRRAS
jgi:hypothetical protein